MSGTHPVPALRALSPRRLAQPQAPLSPALTTVASARSSLSLFRPELPEGGRQEGEFPASLPTPSPSLLMQADGPLVGGRHGAGCFTCEAASPLDQGK